MNEMKSHWKKFFFTTRFQTVVQGLMARLVNHVVRTILKKRDKIGFLRLSRFPSLFLLFMARFDSSFVYAYPIRSFFRNG